MRSLAAAGALLASAGCITHLPPMTDAPLSIHWAEDFAAAQARAEAERKPILVCLVAGALDGPC